MKKILFNFLHLLGLPFVFLALMLGLSRLKRKNAKYQQDKVNYQAVDRYRCIYKLAKKILYVKHVKVSYVGFKNLPKKPVLFVLNHKSQIDPIVMVKVLFETEGLPYFSVVAKTELKERKVFGAGMSLIDTIFIDRGNLRQEYEVFLQQIDTITKDDKSVLVFIEGTRVYGDEMGEFKEAALKVAYQTMIPIVPVVIYGSSGLLDSDKSNVNKNKHVYVKALDLIKPTEFITTNQKFISDQIRTKIQDEYNKMKELDKNKQEVLPKEE